MVYSHSDHGQVCLSPYLKFCRNILMRITHSVANGSPGGLKYVLSFLLMVSSDDRLRVKHAYRDCYHPECIQLRYIGQNTGNIVWCVTHYSSRSHLVFLERKQQLYVHCSTCAICSTHAHNMQYVRPVLGLCRYKSNTKVLFHYVKKMYLGTENNIEAKEITVKQREVIL